MDGGGNGELSLGAALVSPFGSGQGLGVWPSDGAGWRWVEVGGVER